MLRGGLNLRVQPSGFIRLSHLNIFMPESIQQAVPLQVEKNPLGKYGSDQRSTWRGLFLMPQRGMLCQGKFPLCGCKYDAHPQPATGRNASKYY
jgi:hypothetical protein